MASTQNAIRSAPQFAIASTSLRTPVELSAPEEHRAKWPARFELLLHSLMENRGGRMGPSTTTDSCHTLSPTEPRFADFPALSDQHGGRRAEGKKAIRNRPSIAPVPELANKITAFRVLK